MTGWADGPLGGLDLETTAPDPERARIVTACVGWADPAKPSWAPRTWLARQAEPIPDEATAIHGITTEHANTHGADPADVVQQVADAVRAVWALGAPLVIFNAPYDLTVLDRELRRHGLPPFDVAGPVIDPLVLDKWTDRWRRGSRKLGALADLYGIPLGDDAHGAAADTFAAVRCAYQIAGRPQPGNLDAGRLGDLDPARLHDLQVDAYATERARFAEYRRAKGEPLEDESLDWPIRPWKETV